MNIPIKIKRGRGRPRKSVINAPEPIVETLLDVPIVEIPDVPIVEIPDEPIVNKSRKVNQWVEHCTEVKNRPENASKSYREILKIAKLDYQK